VRLLDLLQTRGRLSAAQLAAELEVSQRTVLRDIEALSSAGIPVYGVRGKLGGFELIDGFSSDLPAARLHQPAEPHRPAGATGHARIRLSPTGRRLAVLLGRPPGLRIRRGASTEPDRPGRPDRPDRPGWVQARIRVESQEATVLDILALGAEAELIDPPDLRDLVREAALRIAGLHVGRISGVSIELNHTIVACRDQERSAAFLTGILGLPPATRFSHFHVVQADNGVSLDFSQTTGEIRTQHYAFLVGEDEFDAAFGRIREQGLTYWADPGRTRRDEVNDRDDGRGLYFENPDGHLLEILTRPYGSGD
jgi:catechol 2,3-dioxygenase-like lactoylglutathione lyase family enzyme/biotin operon repressor